MGTFVGLNPDEEAFIVLKELPTLQMLKLKESSEKEKPRRLSSFKIYFLLFWWITIFTKMKALTKNENEEVSSLIFESLDLTVKVVSEYTSSSFFTQRRKSG